MPSELSTAIVNLKRDEAQEMIEKRAASGEDPMTIIDDCRAGMMIVGERYNKGEFFLAELVLSGQIFKQAFEVLQPYLVQSGPAKNLGTVVLATLKGDIHDLGKDIVGTMLEARGFAVHNLGVNVPPQSLLDKVKAVQPDFVGLSVLMTTIFDTMKTAADQLAAEGLRDSLKILIGGAVVTSELRDYIGADFHTTDAMAGVAYCMANVKGDE
jgi:methanogenic corrinoid protein MtbC1